MKWRASSICTCTFGFVDDVEVVRAEVLRHHLRHQRLDLGDRLALERRIDAHRARRHARAAADDEHASSAFGGNSVVRWPSIRWRRMSCGSLDACTLPAL